MLQYKQIFIKTLPFLTGTPVIWTEWYLDPSTKPPYYQIGRCQYYGICFFLCVDLELKKIVIYFSFFKALYPAFPYLGDSSAHIVTGLWVPRLLVSQKFQSSFRSCPSLPPSLPSQCTLIMVLVVTNHHTGSKRLALISENLKDISH